MPNTDWRNELDRNQSQKRKLNKGLVIFGLIISVILVIGAFFGGWYSNQEGYFKNQQTNNQTFNEWIEKGNSTGYLELVFNDYANFGYGQAVMQVFEESIKCNQKGFPIIFNNQTRNLISIECIQLLQSQ